MNDFIVIFLYVVPSLYLCDEADLIMVLSFDVFLDSVWCILLIMFASLFISEISLSFSFLVESLCGFGILLTVVLEKEFVNVPSIRGNTLSILGHFLLKR